MEPEVIMTEEEIAAKKAMDLANGATDEATESEDASTTDESTEVEATEIV